VVVDKVVPVLALLACPVGMGLCMWFMRKGMGERSDENADSGSRSVEHLRREHDRLGAEIAQLDDSEREKAAT
jgi:hypothetical protein